MTPSTKRICTVALTGLLILSLGCETTGQSTALGAVAGAAAGAAIGQQKDKPLEGALIGAAVGAAAGYGVGRVRAQKVQTAEATAADRGTVAPVLGPTASAPSGNPSGIAMTPPQEIQRPAPSTAGTGQVSLLEIEEVAVAPQRVQPGGAVEASMEYALLGSGEVPVTETRVVQKDGKTLQVLSNETFARTGGTWVSEFNFTVPSGLAPGTYTLVQQVQAGGAVSNRAANFTVG